MAVPTVFGVGTVAATATTGGTGPISPGLPAGFAANHIHVCFMETSNEPVTLISGWNLAGSGFVAQSGGLVTGLTVWWRRAQAGDTAPSITGPGTSTSHLIARIIGVAGCVTSGDPWDVTSYTTENVADNSIVISSVNATAGTDVLALWGVATGQDTTTAQLSPATWTNSSVTGVATQMNNWTTSGDGGGFAVGSGAKAGGGAIGPVAGSLATVNFKAHFLGALKGAATVAPTFYPLMAPPVPG